MKVLLVGVGGVGEAIAVMAGRRPWAEKIVLADYNLERAKEVQAKLKDTARFPVEFVDAGRQNSDRGPGAQVQSRPGHECL